MAGIADVLAELPAHGGEPPPPARSQGPFLVPRPLAQAMEDLESDQPVVVADALRRLGQEVFNNVPAKAMCADAAGQVVQAMRRHRRDAAVQIGGVKLERSLAFRVPANCAKVGLVGGVSVVIEAMATHDQHQEVNSEAVWTLMVLCTDNANNLRIAERMARRPVARAVEAFPGCKPLVSKAAYLTKLFDDYAEEVRRAEELTAAAAAAAAGEEPAPEPPASNAAVAHTGEVQGPPPAGEQGEGEGEGAGAVPAAFAEPATDAPGGGDR